MFARVNTAACQQSHPVAEAANLNLRSMFSRQQLESFGPGEAVFWEGDRATHVFEVIEGILRIVKILNDGRRVITAFMHPGDLVSISLHENYPYTAEAVTSVKIRRCARNRFQDEITRFPELRPQLFSHLCEEMAAAQEQMVLLARKSAEEKVCSFILNIARRSRRESPSEVELPMSRLDMADYLGLTIETVSRTMTSLTSRGVITAKGRHNIAIQCIRRLTRLAGESDDDNNRRPGRTDVQQRAWQH